MMIGSRLTPVARVFSLVLAGCSAGVSPTAPPAAAPAPTTPAPLEGVATPGATHAPATPTPGSGAFVATDCHPAEVPNVGNKTAATGGRARDSAPALLSPAEGAVIGQDDLRLGCAPSPTHGHGFRIGFDWEDVCSPQGVEGYQVWLMQENAIHPAFDVFVSASEYVHTCCNCYVIDPNAHGWSWRVRARDGRGAWGEWSQERTLSFTPCQGSVPACG